MFAAYRLFRAAIMEQLLCFLLLPLGLCLASAVTVMKTIGGEPDATPICTNTTESVITLIVCEIHTERIGGECRLLYRYREGFVHDCDSRFTLMMENQTVFLHLTSLTPVDSGNYTCECSHSGGMDVLHLSITVEEEGGANPASRSILLILIIVTELVVITTGFIFGVICLCKRKRHRSATATATSEVLERETPNSFEEDDPNDPYASLQQPSSDLYQTISHSRSNIEHFCIDNQEIDGKSEQSGEDVYENITP